MLQTCWGLQRLATRHNPNASVVILHHSLAGRAGMRKAIGYDAGGYAKGSKAFVQWVRGQLNIAPASETDNTRLVVSCGKNSNGPWFEPFGAVHDPDTMVYEVDDTFDLATWQASLTAPSAATTNDRPTPENIALLVKHLPLAGPAFAKAIMEEWGVSQPTAYRQILAARGKTIKRNARREYMAFWSTRKPVQLATMRHQHPHRSVRPAPPTTRQVSRFLIFSHGADEKTWEPLPLHM